MLNELMDQYANKELSLTKYLELLGTKPLPYEAPQNDAPQNEATISYDDDLPS